jgi:multicomponent Na+:H+ antiporter subunit E
MVDARAKNPSPHLSRAFALRLGVLLLLWWILTDGSGGWGFGLPVALLITAFSLWLAPPARRTLRPAALPGFAMFFLLQSLRAGWDVARRTLSRDMGLSPALVRVPLKLPHGAPTWWLMATVSLLPGTLSARIDRASVEIHCLDDRLDVVGDVDVAQARIATLFGLDAITHPEEDA